MRGRTSEDFLAQAITRLAEDVALALQIPLPHRRRADAARRSDVTASVIALSLFVVVLVEEAGAEALRLDGRALLVEIEEGGLGVEEGGDDVGVACKVARKKPVAGERVRVGEVREEQLHHLPLHSYKSTV